MGCALNQWRKFRRPRRTVRFDAGLQAGGDHHPARPHSDHHPKPGTAVQPAPIQCSPASTTPSVHSILTQSPTLTRHPPYPALTRLHHSLGALDAALRGEAVHEARLGPRCAHQLLVHLRSSAGKPVDRRSSDSVRSAFRRAGWSHMTSLLTCRQPSSGVRLAGELRFRCCAYGWLSGE